ncbi:MAG: H+/Cl- antiporter ClcA [Burkholderiaceae bacterium]|jgi:H+/Cl- antiporter ClcA
MQQPIDAPKPPSSKVARRGGRISRTTLTYAVFLGGASCVALISLAFAILAEFMLSLNVKVIGAYSWSAFLMLPFGFAGLRWLTLRHAPQARGSGIPQVIAAMSLPASSGAQKTLVSLRQSLWKIGLTATSLLLGASSGREGPSVQVGAAVMLSWGQWWHEKLGLRLGFRPEALIAAGAAGGLAAAFNTPLAGIVFAIEELGRNSAIRWDRIVLSGVLTAGFLSLALLGGQSYFRIDESVLILRESWKGVLLCALINGVLGGLFSKILLMGPTGMLPARWRHIPMKRPLLIAFACGLVVAIVGWSVNGSIYGTGYDQTAALLNGRSPDGQWFGMAKWLATVATYFAGIPGGIFTPCLAIGAGIGENIALLFNGMMEPRIFALISMAAFLAAATQAPITASVIVMEMTKSHDATLYLLAATLIASFVARQLSPHAFYHSVARSFRREALTLHHAGSANAVTGPLPDKH